jgi:hypothetical protein
MRTEKKLDSSASRVRHINKPLQLTHDSTRDFKASNGQMRNPVRLMIAYIITLRMTNYPFVRPYSSAILSARDCVHCSQLISALTLAPPNNVTFSSFFDDRHPNDSGNSLHT